MKFNDIMLSIITVCVLAITCGGLYLGFVATNRVESEISTNIQEKVTQKVQPDKATVNFGVSFKSPDLAVANKSVKERTAQILQFLKQKGISEEKIKTTENAYQDYDYSIGTPKVIGYNNSLSISVVFEKLDSKSTVIEQVANELVAQTLVDNYNISEYSVSNLADVCKELAKKSDAQAEAALKEYATKIKGFTLLKMEKTNEGNCEQQNRYYPPVAYSAKVSSDSLEKSVYMGENEYYNQTSLKIIYQIR